MINFGNLVKLFLIKFNFNGNLTSNVDKKGIKIILVVFTVFIFIVISGLIGIGTLITSTINSMGEVAEEYNRQQKYVQSLPILKCAIYTDETVSAPLSGEKEPNCQSTEHYMILILNCV